MAATPYRDPHHHFATDLHTWAADVLAGRVSPTPAHICALRKAVAAVAQRARAADIGYDEDCFVKHSED